jgi:hypothetical protein
MLGPRGNPTAESLFAIIKVLHDCMDAGGTTTRTWEVELRRERQPRATHGAVAEDAERITLAVKPTRHAA